MTNLSIDQMGLRLSQDIATMSDFQADLGSAFLEDPSLNGWSELSGAMAKLFICYSSEVAELANGAISESAALSKIQACGKHALEIFREHGEMFKYPTHAHGPKLSPAYNGLFEILLRYYKVADQTIGMSQGDLSKHTGIRERIVQSVLACFQSLPDFGLISTT